MEIKIIIDDRIVSWGRRLLSRPVLAAVAGATVLLAGAGIVHAVGSLITFQADTTISATDVNANFKTLSDGIKALESKPNPVSQCTAHYGTSCGGGVSCGVTCAAGQIITGGGCDTSGGDALLESYPADASGNFGSSSTPYAFGSWVCKVANGSSTVWPFAICCPG